MIQKRKSNDCDKPDIDSFCDRIGSSPRHAIHESKKLENLQIEIVTVNCIELISHDKRVDLTARIDGLFASISALMSVGCSTRAVSIKK